MLKKLFNNRARQEMRRYNDSGMSAREVSSIGIRAKVTRADGRVEPDRLVSYGHKNPLIHLVCAPLAYLNGAFWNWHYTHNRRQAP